LISVKGIFSGVENLYAILLTIIKSPASRVFSIDEVGIWKASKKKVFKKIAITISTTASRKNFTIFLM
jgi:hypothetical protein